MKCEFCTDRAKWLAYASYDIPTREVHPRVARYPSPMVAACNDHLLPFLEGDSVKTASTRQWVLKMI